MLARLAVLAVSLVVAATASGNPLTGAWRSDRDLTLGELNKSSRLTLGQREFLSSPDLFGQLVTIYGDSEIELRLAEQSARLSYRIVATGSDFVDIEYGDRPSDAPVRMRLLLHQGLLYVPVEDLGFHQVFRRVDAPAALAP
jgi:hypothetical protein